MLLVTLASAAGAAPAFAQAGPKPGPMQSGAHVGADAPPQPSPPAEGQRSAGAEPFDVGMLFANTCGWCHSGGGREPGKGPRLMGSELSDAELASRIRIGKVGQMPAFSGAFTEPQLKAIVAYIRALKPAQQEGKAR